MKHLTIFLAQIIRSDVFSINSPLVHGLSLFFIGHLAATSSTSFIQYINISFLCR